MGMNKGREAGKAAESCPKSYGNTWEQWERVRARHTDGLPRDSELLHFSASCGVTG